MTEQNVYLSNGEILPAIGYGTGVVKKYYRNKILYLKNNIKPLLGVLKHHRLGRKLQMDLKGTEIIRLAYQCGFRLFDSGRIYGHSEKVIGNGLSEIERETYFLCTKISDMDLDRKYSPTTVKENLDDSLRYLCTDYVDLYLLHYPHGDWVNIYKEMEEIYESGKAKAIGICNFTINELEILMSQCKIIPSVCQVELHPLNSKKELRTYCNEKNIVLMAHTPTGRMCGKIITNPILKELADKYGKTIAQIILRWHIQNRVIPVVSTVSEIHMKEDMDIFNFSLSDEDMQKVESINENYVLLDSQGIDDANYRYNL